MTVYEALSCLTAVVAVLVSVAYLTLLERRVMASMQRRVGPDTVGVAGTLQPFADALKLLLKQVVVTTQSAPLLFIVAPTVSLITALLSWAVIPWSHDTALVLSPLSWLIYLTLGSLGVYGVLLGGWAANSSYTMLGAVRCTAHMVSYELVLSGSALCVLLMGGTMDLIVLQHTYWLLPLLPLSVVFAISALAELNRVPFDLVEAESELVSGFMTEHAGVVFVMFFLAEYANIALMSCLTAVLWLGGAAGSSSSWLSATGSSLLIATKTLIIVAVIVWVRATLPRLRFDQLMLTCWAVFLPVTFAVVTLVLSLIVLL